MPENVLLYLFAAAFGYGLGSIPFGLLITRLAGTADIRSIGSGNIGATNVLRTGRKDLAAATLVLDALKGSVAVWVALRWGVSAGVIAGFAAFLGHLYPLWLGFKGGKGVATYIGVLLAFNPVLVLAFAVLWGGVAYFSRYSSLAALVAAGAIGLFEAGSALFGGRLSLGMAAIIAMTLLLFWKHRPNIERLVAGTEGKIGQKG